MKTRDELTQIISDITDETFTAHTLDLFEVVYRIGFYDGVNAEQEKNMAKFVK